MNTFFDRTLVIKAIYLLALAFCSWMAPSSGYAAEKSFADLQVTALNPRGNQPPIHLTPLAPRLDTLEGKTIYLVDVRFMGGDMFLKQIQAWFSDNMPGVKTVFREKRGSYGEDDPELWAEIAEKGDGMIIAIGH